MKPHSDPVDVAGRFHATVAERVPASALGRIAEIFLAAATPEEGATAVLDDPELGSIGSSILKLWLLGSWHEPATPGVSAEVIAAGAYRDSPVWLALRSHLMNTSMFSFGYWSRPRSALSPAARPA